MRNPLSLLPRANVDLGLLILRVGVGLSFVGHGVPKLLGGPERWTSLGGAMATFGIDFAPAAWGLAAALAEGVGGLMLALGLLTRITTLPMAFTMLIAFSRHVAQGDPWGRSAHSFEMLVVFCALFWLGPGRFSLDHVLGRRAADPAPDAATGS